MKNSSRSPLDENTVANDCGSVILRTSRLNFLPQGTKRIREVRKGFLYD